jgi:NAD(P)-dependent dehydrogenase (short-subunit alcohol dehydrogenase family)
LPSKNLRQEPGTISVEESKEIVKNETVVITGASAGLGRAVVREFGRHGAKVGLLARGIDGPEAARHEIESLGGRAVALPTDAGGLQFCRRSRFCRQSYSS